MNLSWIKEAILKKTGGLPGKNNAIFSASLALHLGDKLFHSQCQENIPDADTSSKPLSRPTYLLLQTLCQAGFEKLYVHTPSEYRPILTDTIHRLPDSITTLQQSDTVKMIETDCRLFFAGNDVTAPFLPAHNNTPSIWVNWVGPLVMVVPFNLSNHGVISTDKSEFITKSNSLLLELSSAYTLQAWQHIISGQLAVFLAVLYATLQVSQTGEVPWLLIDTENARFCRQGMEFVKSIEDIENKSKSAVNFLKWENFSSDWS